ncbi:CPBP family glutamic-type intramembrane protease [Nafulsella turpanensis]|uniref:CPBP family glutamic-type intramembrane protease n=1 Tax=Nafulsella turpanensis TaxID=1265690 RepID=UPI00135F1749|nr:CPBP family glutamic-type intramembrane protease [Nafulsella turpanensis]
MRESSLFNAFIHNLKRYQTWLIIVVAVIVSIFYNVISPIVFSLFSETEIKTEGLEGLTPELTFIIVAVLGPIVETFLFQFLVIEIIKIFFKNSQFLPLAISAGLFAYAHSYSDVYIVFALIPGFILALSYILFKAKGNNAFFFVFVIHALVNTFSFIFNHYIQN